MLEWLKRHAWKACNRPKRFGGSNPPLSAENQMTAAAQDEWLVSPEMTLAANETLHFLLQADYFDVYDVTDFDWSALTYPNPRTVVNTLKVMLSENDGETWTEVWDLAKNVTDQLTDVQCYYLERKNGVTRKVTVK